MNVGLLNSIGPATLTTFCRLAIRSATCGIVNRAPESISPGVEDAAQTAENDDSGVLQPIRSPSLISRRRPKIAGDRTVVVSVFESFEPRATFTIGE